MRLHQLICGRDSSIGIATRYGLKGQNIESRWKLNYQNPSTPALGPNQTLLQWVRSLSREKSGREMAFITTPSSADVKERVELYTYSSSGPSWPVLGWPLPVIMSVSAVSSYIISTSKALAWDELRPAAIKARTNRSQYRCLQATCPLRYECAR